MPNIYGRRYAGFEGATSAVFISLYFLRSKFKLESRGTGVGYKIPPAEVLHRINGSANKANLKRSLRPDSHESRASSSTTNNFSYKTAPPGLLQESGPVDDSNDCKTDCVRTPTGAGLRQ